VSAPKVFVTGASGFIGRAFLKEAQARGFDLLCLARDAEALNDTPGDAASDARDEAPKRHSIAEGDLDTIPWRAVERFAPDALLHLAWIATPGEYLDSPVNARLLEQSIALIEGLTSRGVSRLAAVGSCIEYAPSDAPLVEATSSTLADSPYASAKIRLHDWLVEHAAASGAAWSWLRVFYPYGPGEHPGRITSAFIRNLAAGERVVLRTPGSVKDFIYVTDLARALCDALEARLDGDVNLGSGTGTSIRRIAELCADAVGAPPDHVVDADILATDPRPTVIADTTRIRSTGWRPKTPLEQGLHHLAHTLTAA